jgi:hypothetical protein
MSFSVQGDVRSRRRSEKSASLLPILAQEGVQIIAGTDAGHLQFL